MGGDGADERVFATLEKVCDHGGDQWWLYLSRCNACEQNWMVAQDDRIHDDYYMRRLSPGEAAEIMAGRWPDEFITYERVLRTGRTLSSPWTYLDPLDSSLAWTVRDLRRARPEITATEIAYLFGVEPKVAIKLFESE